MRLIGIKFSLKLAEIVFSNVAGVIRYLASKSFWEFVRKLYPASAGSMVV